MGQKLDLGDFKRIDDGQGHACGAETIGAVKPECASLPTIRGCSSPKWWKETDSRTS